MKFDPCGSRTRCYGIFEVYRERFEETWTFFEGSLQEVGKLDAGMTKAVMKRELKQEEEEEKAVR